MIDPRVEALASQLDETIANSVLGPSRPGPRTAAQAMVEAERSDPRRLRAAQREAWALSEAIAEHIIGPLVDVHFPGLSAPRLSFDLEPASEPLDPIGVMMDGGMSRDEAEAFFRRRREPLSRLAPAAAREA